MKTPEYSDRHKYAQTAIELVINDGVVPCADVAEK